jgi:membrane-bound lytic murein transglycosylase D
MIQRIAGRGCAVWLLAGLLAACSGSHERPDSTEVAQPPAPPPTAPAPPPAPPETPPPPVDVPRVESPWARIRAQFAMPGCDYRPQVLSWARRFAAHPAHFSASLENAMPMLLVALEESERLRVPGEFALLPYIESHFQPVPGRGSGPAGMWQIGPGTARAAGLVVSEAYDGRLDALESSRAALGLIARYGERFGDWRLADIAFNAGEYRVRRVVGDADTRSWPAQRFARLGLPRTSHEHLDKLLAIACIVADPERFGVDLPEPRATDHLQAIPLAGPIDLRIAARLAGVGIAELRRLNAGYRRDRMSAQAPLHLYLPANRAGAFIAAIDALPPAELQKDWHEQTIRKPVDVDALAARNGVTGATLRRVNALDPATREMEAGQTLLLPGRGNDPLPVATPRTYVVRAGDTLSQIAHRHGITLRELLRWNRWSDAGVLHPGDRLHLGPGSLD